MNNLIIDTSPEFEAVLAKYPPFVKEKMQFLRALIIESAEELPDVKKMEETLKWGEPSFVTKGGSTLRIDWKGKFPNQYAIYFKCTSRLVETFKTVFGSEFQYEGKRAIVFQLDEEVPTEALKSCIKAALNYHKVKHLQSLGI